MTTDLYRVSPQQQQVWDCGRSAAGSRLEAGCDMRVNGPLVESALAAAFDAIVARAEILRTQVIEGDFGRPVQQILSWPALVSLQVDSAGPSTHRLELRASAYVADATTMRYVAHQLWTEYAARAEGSADADPLEPLQYVDLTEWLAQTAARPEGREHWLELGRRCAPTAHLDDLFGETLAGVPFRAGSIRADLDGLVPASLVRAGLVAALSWVGARSQLVVAEVMDGRGHPDLRTLLGPLSRHIPLVCDLDTTVNLTELAIELDHGKASAWNWQDYFSAEDFRPKSPGADQPLALPFVFEELPAPFERVVAGARVSSTPIWADIDRYLMKIVLTGGKLIEVRYDTSRVSRAAAQDFLDVLMTAVVDGAQRPVGDVHSGTDSRWWLAGPALDPPFTAFPQLVREQALLAPDRPAVVFGDDQLTYAQLIERADMLATRLRRYGAGRGRIVALHVPPSLDLIVAVLATLDSGAAYLPLDIEAPDLWRAAIVDEAQPCCVIATAATLPPQSLATAVVLVDDTNNDSAQETRASPPGARDAAYVLYTSGSTGRPKGVVVEHGNVSALWRSMSTAIHESKLIAPVRVALNAAITFDASVQQLVFLAGGHTVHVLPNALRRDDVDLVDYIHRHQLGVVNCTPSQLRPLLDAGLLDADTHSPTVLLIAGEHVDEDLWVRLAAEPVVAYNIYGPTECTVNATSARILGSGTNIGTPLPDYQIIVADERLNPLPVDISGELYIGGAGVSRGYLGRPDLTAERFVPSPFGPPGARLYRSGDRAVRRADGTLAFLGRTDRQVKVRGVRIELGEIEAALRRQSGVADAVVVLRAEAAPARLDAYVIANRLEGERADLAPSALRSVLSDELPAAMVPSTFTLLEAWPLTSSGKLDHAALREPGADSRPATRYQPPRSLAEEILAAVWARTLAVAAVGIDDNFFGLGGDSIRCIQARVLAAERGVHFTVQDLFSHQTIRALADEVAARGNRRASAPIAAQAPFALLDPRFRTELPADVVDAFPALSKPWAMLEHGRTAQAEGVLQNVRTIDLVGPFSEPAIRQALDQATQCHEGLRTSFHVIDGRPVQAVHGQARIDLDVVDLSGETATEQAAELRRALLVAQTKPFDFAAGAPIRLLVHRLSDRRFRLTISMHEVGFDGWSIAILLTDLLRYYLEALAGRSVKPQRPSIALRARAAAEQRALADPAEAAFWSDYAKGDGHGQVLTRLNPGGLPNGSLIRFVPIPDRLSQLVAQVGRELAVPIKTVLLAVHLRVLAQLACTAEPISGVVVNCRPDEAGGDLLLGQLSGTVIIRGSNDGPVRESILATFDQEQLVHSHRFYPVAAVRQLAGRPIFDALFNFTHFHVFANAQFPPGFAVVAEQFYPGADFGLLTDFSLDWSTSQIRLNLNAPVADVADLDAIGARYLAELEGLSTCLR